MSWDEWNRTGGPKYPHAKVVQFVFRNFDADARRGAPALDLGCGSGVHTCFLADEGFAVTGVDISPQGIDNTRRRLEAKGLRAELAVQDLGSLDVPEARFRLVICIGVLDSAGLAAARIALPRVHRAMAPGGKAIFVFASDRDLRIVGDNPYGLHGWVRPEIDEVFDVGFGELFVDQYVTTYRGGTSEHRDWLVTAIK